MLLLSRNARLMGWIKTALTRDEGSFMPLVPFCSFCCILPLSSPIIKIAHIYCKKMKHYTEWLKDVVASLKRLEGASLIVFPSFPLNEQPFR